MIIATSNTQPVPSSPKADAAGGTTRTGSPDAVDAASAAATETVRGFGRILAQRLDDGSTSDVAKPDPRNVLPADAGLLSGPDGQPLATTNAVSAAVAGTDVQPAADASADIDVAPAIAAAAMSFDRPVAKSGVAPGDERPTAPPKKEGDDAAANDLAAQIALVSQWAALPPTPSSGTAGDAKADGLDIQGKLDAVRVTSSKPGAATPLPPLATEQVPAAVLPFVASTAPTFDRTPRGSGTTAAAVTRSVDAVAKDDASASAAGDRLSLAEAILGKVDTAGVHGQNDAMAMAGAFVTQVTAQASNAQAAAAAPAPPTPSILHEPVGTTAWTHEVGQATLRMAANDLQGASLRLNPEHLGPLDVQVRIDNGVAHLAFSAAHVETRQALEASRTTLDQMFADQGLKIGDCAVGDPSTQRRFDADATQDGSPRAGQRWASTRTGSDDTATSTVTTTVRRALGLVDTFA